MTQTRKPAAAGRPPANKGRKYPAEILRPEEVTAILRACSTRAPSGIRNRALIAVLYRGGLRLAEALALDPKDLDLTRGAVRVPGKHPTRPVPHLLVNYRG